MIRQCVGSAAVVFLIIISAVVATGAGVALLLTALVEDQTCELDHFATSPDC